MNFLSEERILLRSEINNVMHIAMPGIRILSLFNSEVVCLYFLIAKEVVFLWQVIRCCTSYRFQLKSSKSLYIYTSSNNVSF